MEGLGKLHRAGAVFALLVLLAISATSPAAARPTVAFLQAAREVDPAHARPCDVAAAVSLGSGGVGVPDNDVKVTQNYAPLLLNVLPRGYFPPSGPSKGINDVKP